MMNLSWDNFFRILAITMSLVKRGDGRTEDQENKVPKSKGWAPQQGTNKENTMQGQMKSEGRDKMEAAGLGWPGADLLLRS